MKIQNPTDEQFLTLSRDVDALLLKHEELGWKGDHLVTAVIVCVSGVAIASSTNPKRTLEDLRGAVEATGRSTEELQAREINK